MPPTPNRSKRPASAPAPRPARRRLGARRRREGGQSLVEFSLILAPLLLLLLGIVQFGFIFNTYITVSTAAREAAREGTIYVYDRDITQTANDTLRNNRVKSAFIASLNGLAKTSPNFTTGSGWTSTTSGSTITYTNGDITITYSLPATVTDSDPRQGWRLTVKGTFHQDLVVPLVNGLLPADAGGRLSLAGEVTMVIN
jgi:Flp pilus assembly protein TadG